MTPIIGFAPGLDPTTPGVVTDCYQMIPTAKGMKACGSGDNVGVDPLPAACYGAATITKIDNSSRTFAGTATKLYEMQSNAWVDRSRAGNYTATPTRWNFTQFGDVTIACNKLDATQYSITGAFADLTGSPPKAQICETSSGFVLLFNYNDGANDYTDGWWCSGLYDYTAWTPSPATQAANGRFFDSPGKVTAAKRLAGGVAVYKDNAIYVGQYVGPPVIWSWTQIAADTGAYCQDAVINVSGVHYFLGRNGLFMFDGSRPQAIGALEVRDWLRTAVDPAHTDKVVAGYDSKTSIIYWFLPYPGANGVAYFALCYNTMTGMFGKVNVSAKAVIDLQMPDLSWSGVGALGATWADIGAALPTWSASILLGSGVGLSFVGVDGLVFKFESTALDSSITFGDVGDDTVLQTLQRVRPRFMKQPDSAQMYNAYKRNLGDDLTYDKSIAMSDNKFDVLRSDRWHRVRLEFMGDCEITAIDYKLKPNGTR